MLSKCQSGATAYFNPRSREGSDVQPASCHFGLVQFQSTLPRGERQEVSDPGIKDRIISIHAPARGATSFYKISFPHVNFNPRSREGSDVQALHRQQVKSPFQSTLPRGERRNCGLMFKPNGKFQSTLPRGERHKGGTKNRVDNEFQSTLPRGERYKQPNNGRRSTIFQSTLPRGERL